MTALLEVRDLSVSFLTSRGAVPVLAGVSLSVGEGEVVGLVGESGSGKSVTALAILGLLGEQGRVEGGEIRLDGRDLLPLPEREWLRVRGRQIAMVFQEPMTSLNPLLPVGFQVAEVLEAHLGLGRREALARAVELLRDVGIPDSGRRAQDYPHQLSGGMRQRVMIAMAMACRPRLLIGDEPTTALDVTIQAQILALLRDLGRAAGTAVLLISHDLGVVAAMASRVVVMYAGQVVEEAPARELFSAPRHPYTRLLLAMVPGVREKRSRLSAIAGSIPAPAAMPAGCRFHPRCPDAIPLCREAAPTLDAHGPDRRVRCWRADGVRP
ncbi:MAG TPA: ABC transporter ATP-binding protein [Methylomirabilota bacterium]|nr:ABC transporter ATP-binding protein [Methylomirabilota bacterium]